MKWIAQKRFWRRASNIAEALAQAEPSCIIWLNFRHHYVKIHPNMFYGAIFSPRPSSKLSWGSLRCGLPTRSLHAFGCVGPGLFIWYVLSKKMEASFYIFLPSCKSWIELSLYWPGTSMLHNFFGNQIRNIKLVHILFYVNLGWYHDSLFSFFFLPSQKKERIAVEFF